MDSKIIQKRIDDLAKSMMAKGMRSPDAHIWIKANSEPTVYLKWKSGIRDSVYGTGEKSKFLNGALADVLTDAAAFVTSQPDAETAKLNDFMSALGSVIDLGKEHGIETDFLNPLTETMKRLSENALTDQRAA